MLRTERDFSKVDRDTIDVNLKQARSWDYELLRSYGIVDISGPSTAARTPSLPVRTDRMTRRLLNSPPDRTSQASQMSCQAQDEAFTFTDVTVLVLLAVSTAAVAALLLLGTVSAEHRIGAVLGLW